MHVSSCGGHVNSDNLSSRHFAHETAQMCIFISPYLVTSVIGSCELLGLVRLNIWAMPIR